MSDNWQRHFDRITRETERRLQENKRCTYAPTKALRDCGEAIAKLTFVKKGAKA